MFKLFDDSFNDSFIKVYFQSLLLLERRLRIITNNALTLREVMVLSIIDRLSKTKRNTSGNIALYLQVSPPVISTSIKTLIKKGYVVKRINHDDNRYFYLDLTEKGKESNKKSLQYNSKIIQKIIGNLSPFDLKGIYKLFKTTEQIIDEENKSLDIEEKK
jgi:DNA-binding MarR family transcriptional regulator